MKAIDEAKHFLITALAAGPRKAMEVIEEGQRAGVSVTTFKRARQALGVRSKKVGGRRCDQYWTWKLPDESKGEEGQSPTEPSATEDRLQAFVKKWQV